MRFFYCIIIDFLRKWAFLKSYHENVFFWIRFDATRRNCFKRRHKRGHRRRRRILRNVTRDDHQKRRSISSGRSDTFSHFFGVVIDVLVCEEATIPPFKLLSQFLFVTLRHECLCDVCSSDNVTIYSDLMLFKKLSQSWRRNLLKKSKLKWLW